MKHFFVYIVFFLFNSCNYFDGAIPSEKELLKKELESINWKEVDEYPSFEDCKEVEDKLQQKKCFFEYLSLLIQEKLTVDTLAMMYPELDTIEVKVTVFPDSRLKFEPQHSKDSIVYDTIKIDSILKVRLVNFPLIKPAIKRGIPVKTQFILPIIIKSE